ncbi:MAG: tRNA (adenosine(37)-N6)-threonylcarbamoyltransferase complex dimerization subunit type 1 TsaB [Verrucomicrobiota bacterium]
MKILALEFSSTQRSVAVVEANPTTAPAILSEIVDGDGRMTNALPLVDESLREAGVEREQIDSLAIGIGPGSYTGIRSAIALAQGWQLAREIKLLAIGSVECIAEQARLLGLRGRMHIVIDAQRNEFYVATYEVGDTSVQNRTSLTLATLADVQTRLVGSEPIVGPEVKRWFPLGQIVFPRAGVLGQLAAYRNDFVCGEKIEPIYLRETSFVKAPPPRVIPEIS